MKVYKTNLNKTEIKTSYRFLGNRSVDDNTTRVVPGTAPCVKARALSGAYPNHSGAASR